MTRVLTSDGTANGAIAESGFTYDGQYLTVYGTERIQSDSASSIGVGSTEVSTIPTTSGNSGHFEYYVVNGSGFARTGVVMAVWDNTSASFTDTSTTDLNGSTEGISFIVTVSGGDVRLTAVVTVGVWTVKVGTRIIF